MHRFLLLLFILGFGHSIYAASTFEFPNLTRRLPERTSSPGCAYKGDRYEHGERVPTAEPCLNCTCIRAVLVCYLRVCPTASAPPPGCFAAREVGECCPTLVCGGADLSRPSNKSDSDLDLRPTFQPEKEETTQDDSSTTESYSTNIFSSENDSQSDTSQSEDITDIVTSTTDDILDTTRTFETSSTDILSTVSDNVFHTTLNEDDSLVYITSTQEPTHDYDINFFNDIPGGCMVNGTLYGDGSAMLSSTFCEYCFCIRGKSTCLKPKCHLSIDGCIPHYDSHYSCCPSRYECSQKQSSVESSSTEPTTITSSTVSETTEYLDASSDCLVDGTIYHQGEVVPDRRTCHNCYCSDSSVVCEKIQCAPPLEGCHPIIPAGHCCPISYRCDYQNSHLESNNIKGANTSSDNRGSDIKSEKNYFIPNNDVRIKSANDRESVALLHNIIPINRRLDENVVHEQNSTVKNIEEVYIVNKASTKAYSDTDNISDHTRENDKTLNLEFTGATVAVSYPAEERAFDDIHITDDLQDETSSKETVSVGSPEVHTLSIQELFDHFFLKHQINSSKISTDIASEFKRNNSKQPSSIVEIYDSETDIPDSTTANSVVSTKLTTMPEISRNGTEIGNAEADLHSPTYIVPINDTDIVSEYNTESTIDTTHVTNLKQDTYVYNEEKLENGKVSSAFPDAEIHRNDEELYSGTDTESTYPLFISTKEKDNEEYTDITTHSTLPSFTTSDTFSSQDPLETSPSEILTTISDLFNIKFNTQPETRTPFPFTNTRLIHGENPKQTKFTSPVYATTKDDLIEGLKMQTDSRPVVLIYDTTKNLFSEPKTYTQAPTTTLLYDMSKHTFRDEPKYTQTPPASLWFETTKELFTDDAVKQSGLHSTSPGYVTTKNIYSELHSVSPEHTNTGNLMKNVDKTENPLFTAHTSTTTRNINGEYQTETKPSSVHFSTTKNANDDQQTQTQFSSLYTSMMNQRATELQKEAEIPSTIPAHIVQQNIENGEFNTQTDPQSLLTTRKYTNSEGFSKTGNIRQTTPAFFKSTRYQTNKHQESTDAIPTLTTNLPGNIDAKGDEIETTFFTTKTANEDLTPTNPSLPSVQTLKQKDSVTESTRVSTRINSKLPSFNYIEKANEKNTSIHPRFPTISDSVVNVYLPTAENKNNVSDKGDDFTNIGSIFLGAPLSVGESDSRKDSGKPKITQSGGVIFMDPKYTDIHSKRNFQNQERVQKGALSTDTQKQVSTEKSDKDSSNNERKKGPRIQDPYNQSSTGQGYKIIPFVAEDAVRGQFGKLNNTLLVQTESTEGLPDIVSDFCFIKGRIYMNGEMIGKPDPCELCRCFYGRELCQIQRCPTPPDCIPEKVPGFCCPRFTCGNGTTSTEQVSKEVKPVSRVHITEAVTSTTRRPAITERYHPTNDKQEIKYGIRVRPRPTVGFSVRPTEHTTQKKVLMEKITTVKPEIQTLTSKAMVATTTTSRKPVVRPIVSKIPEARKTTTTSTTTSTTTTSTTTTTPSPIFPDPWGLLKVSGCNIYGKFFNINDQVEILSGPCSHCICTTNGVECNDIC